MIAIITTGKGITTFSSEDLLPGGAAHNNTLYLIVTCLYKHVPLAFVNNGSVVNVCPWITIKKLGVKEEKL